MFGIYLTPSFIIHYNKCKREKQRDQSSKTDNKYQREMLTQKPPGEVFYPNKCHWPCFMLIHIDWSTSLELHTRCNPLRSSADILYVPSRQVHDSLMTYHFLFCLIFLSNILVSISEQCRVWWQCCSWKGKIKVWNMNQELRKMKRTGKELTRAT